MLVTKAEADVFQSTLPRGKRPTSCLASSSETNFNPRFREGNDHDDQPVPVCRAISIHASAMEATLRAIDELRLGVISIHASAREAIRGRGGFRSRTADFNPRFREGSDHPRQDDCAPGTISIHASAREAIRAADISGYQNDISIHASAREAIWR